MLTDGKYKIIGDGHSMYKFVVFKYQKVNNLFHVEAQARKAEDILRHFLSLVRKTTASLIRRVAKKRMLDETANKNAIDSSRFARNLNDYKEFLMRYE